VPVEQLHGIDGGAHQVNPHEGGTLHLILLLERRSASA
jgi:hypothetical protein